MKSNFSYLKKLRSNSNFTYGDDINRYLRDLEFLLVDVEKKIYLRKFSEATYPIRMVWDLSKDFIEYIIRESNDPTFVKWNKTLKDLKEKRRRVADYKGTKYQEAIGYRTLLATFPTPDDLHLEGIGPFHNAISVFNELNSWMHYNFDKNYWDENNGNNIHDKSTLYSHRGQVRYSEPKFNNVVNYLETLWYVVINIMIKSGMFDEFGDYRFDFNRELYDNPEFTFKWLLQYKHIDDLVSERRKCPICEEGRFYKPKFEEDYKRKGPTAPYPFGAFLVCESCNAKVDTTLKVKKNLSEDEFSDSDCTKCKSTDSIQKRYSLTNPEWGIYKACNKCSWNNKNQNNNVDIDISDIMDDFESQFDNIYPNDEDDWYND